MTNKTVADQIKRNQALNKAGANTFTTTKKQNTATLSGKKNGKKKDPNKDKTLTDEEKEAKRLRDKKRQDRIDQLDNSKKIIDTLMEKRGETEYASAGSGQTAEELTTPMVYFDPAYNKASKEIDKMFRA